MKMFLGLLQLGERGMGGGAEGKEGDRREIEWGLVKEGWYDPSTSCFSHIPLLVGF